MESFKNAIALTGGIATGKSTASIFLKEFGFKIIDLDSISHEVLDLMQDLVVREFGSEILENNHINRAKLAPIVFNDKSKLAILESILHPKIFEIALQKAQKLKNEIYFIDIPILFELQAKGDFRYQCSKVLLIYAPRKLQLARLMKRNKLSENEANARLDSQIDIELKRKKADFIIENTSDLGNLKEKIRDFVKQF